MNYSAIKKDIEKIKTEIADIGSVEIQKEELNMSVSEFNAILQSVKKYDILENKDSQYFAQVFNNDDYYSNISIYLDQIVRKISISTEKMGVSLKTTKNLQVAQRSINSIMEILGVEYSNLLKADSKKWIARHASERKHIKAILADLFEIDEKVKGILSVYARIIANVVLKEFKVLYKFFLYSIKAAKTNNDQLLLIEIAGMTDRIISIIDPVFSKKSLKTDEMIYHYLAYELKELKIASIGGNLS